MSPPKKKKKRNKTPKKTKKKPKKTPRFRGPADGDERRFRSKYHPDEAGRRQQEAQAALRNRLRVFLYLWERGWLDGLLLDIERAPQIVKTLDAGTPASGGAGG
ncbi:serrate RNA effector molecule homolog, partial [Pyrgilauda ruficollis]|uniref:serrate RNA effector molecule homolog n=1 Tax=Pyrgilauda ruficollis TaxID=221976 RepID=UPI001B8847DF